MGEAAGAAGAGTALDLWLQRQAEETAVLRAGAALWTAPHDFAAREAMRPHFDATARLVAAVEEQAARVRAYLVSASTQRHRRDALHSRAAAQARRVAAVRAHLPPHLASRLPELLAAGSDAADATSPAPAATAARARAGGRPARTARKPTAAEPQPAPAAAPEPAPRRTGSGEFPEVAMVTAAELAAAPQYVKGRLTLAKIEGVVARLNAFLAEKYALLRKKPREVGSADAARLHAFQDSECAETRGEKFVTDAELKAFSDFKMDPTAKTAINVLRHVGALKEVRGKNKTRILIVREIE